MMKSNRPQKIETAKKNQKEENALDIISMSIKMLFRESGRTIDKIYSKKFGLIIGYTMGSDWNISKPMYISAIVEKFHITYSTIKKRKGKRSGYNK